ncbi:MAG TPA: hypothetical protein VMH78_04000 [Thermoplasmata archaeon]|nr:hypothetical protein [Thermoplasmata archaeon]
MPDPEPAAGAWEVAGLAASAPLPELAPRLALFGQFVGDWEITECRNLNADGSWTVERGELHWRWILEGRAVQDVWSTIDEATGRARPIGTTVRFYDSRIDAWHSVWIAPVLGVVRTFVGRAVGDEIVLEGTSARGNPLKWIFSEITPRAFRWRAEELREPPSGWVLCEEMRIRRRAAAAP